MLGINYIMKKKLVAFGFLLLWVGTTKAQSPLAIGYFAPWGVEPGISVGIDRYYKFIGESEAGTEGEERPTIQFKSFYRPQLAFFSRPKYNNNLLFSTDFGIIRMNNKAHRHVSLSVGLGYLSQHEIVTTTVSLDGSGIEKTRDRRGYFLPTLNYTFRNLLNNKKGWFFTARYGKQFSSQYESSAVLMLGLGLEFNLRSGVLVNQKW